MRLLFGAKSCGFGPVSKLAALSRRLPAHRRVFAGHASAAMFAAANPDAFDEIIEVEGGAARAAELIAQCDMVVSVMDEELVFAAFALDRRVVMADSLLAFWQLRRPLEQIAQQCAGLSRGDPGAALRALEPLAPHERKIAAHLLADGSVVQNFPGVPERVAQLGRLGKQQIELCGSMVDTGLLEQARAGAAPDTDLLVNLGGFQNFYLDFDHHNAYLTLIRRWVRDALPELSGVDRVTVCCGGFDGERGGRVEVGGKRADYVCLPQAAFLRSAAGAPHYLMTPGLTSLHEAIVLDRLPLAMPEQHYGHIFNLAGLAGTLFHDLGVRLADIVPGYRVAEDDFEGTAQIVAHTGRILEDDELYRRFRTVMTTRVQAYLATDAQSRAAGTAQLRRLLDGPSFDAALASSLAAHGIRAEATAV
jgi:hypothetical protein